MSLNERATVLWWLVTPQARGHDVIVGDAVLLVADDSVPGFIDVLQREEGFQVEVQLEVTGSEWLEGPRTFQSWFEAAKFALVLEQRFDFVLDVRVVIA